MNNYMDFLLWTKGPAFDIAIFIFIAGVIIRFLEILLLGRKVDLSEPRSDATKAGLRTVVDRTFPAPGVLKSAPFVVITGYIWHIAWFISLFLFIPHIELIRSVLGISWPGLPNQLVDAASVVAMITLIAVLIHRVTHPVLSFLSTKEDYLVWAVTFLPLFTGYFAYHHMLEPYPLALGLHILSVELLLVVFPFTKLMHAFTLFIARWFNGVMLGRKEPDPKEEL